jgi:integrase
MMTAVQPLPLPGASPLLAKLLEAVRPEFQAELIRIDPDHPVFARGRCAVEGCERGGWSKQLCDSHYNRWRLAGRPPLDDYCATTGPIPSRGTLDRTDAFDLRELPLQLRLEVAYSIQKRHDERRVRLIPVMVHQLVALLAASQAISLLERPVADWVAEAIATGRARSGSRTIGQLRYAYRHLQDLAEGTDAESEFARDLWRASMLGLDTTRPPRTVSFAEISQPWLRATAKRHARFRLASGKRLSTIDIEARSIRYFSQFLAELHPTVKDETDLDRSIIEHYISWMTTNALGGYQTNTALVTLRGFLEACRRHRWLPAMPAEVVIYIDEIPRRPRPLPRFVDEFVMAQLEDPDNLDRLPDDTTRHLLVVLMETGLRAFDGCALPFNPVIDDSVGWPCLRFFNHKMAAEQMIPLSSAAAQAIRDQQTHLQARFDVPPPVLFPADNANPDGIRSMSYGTLRDRLSRWERDIGLHDEFGRPVVVTAHQFRHTLGTRMINQGVPQHIVQKMLGHASPQMTARYATIHDTTVRAAFDDYQRHRVDIQGQRLDFDPGAPSADAEWVKHNLSRVAASLPNGYCGRPPQQDCPHPNACLTCPDFQTTPTFLPLHRRQRDDTLELIVAAEQAGNTRLAANHRQVADNLAQVIDALEQIDQETTDDH